MKKFGIVLFIALLAALLTVAVSAKTISFTPLTEGETNYVQTVTKDAGKDNGNWFLDGENYIIYKFPVSSRDIYAKFTATIGAQYEIAVSNDNATYTVIDAAVKPDGAQPNWGADRVSRTYDLASYLTGKNGFIYVRIADADKANGWGPYIVSADKIVFTTSVPAGQSYSFKPFTDDEKKYTYEITADAGNDGGNHFLDGTNYIIYRFPVSSKDSYALFTAKIGAQYMISASNNGKTFKTIEQATKPDGAEANWGADRAMRYIDVSNFITAYDGYIYIKIEDVDKDNGWGPYIVSDAGVTFTTIAPPVVSLYHSDAGTGFVGAGPVTIEQKLDAKDLSLYFTNSMAVGVRVFVKGSAKFVDNGQFELTSSGSCDQQEFHWGSTLGFGIHDGWNYLIYPIAKGQNDNGALYSAINYLRLYQFSDAEFTFNITDIEIGHINSLGH
jgi:hypothetical protein